METITLTDLPKLRGKRVYLAGRYRYTDADGSVFENVLLAKRVAAHCARAGVHYFCPHMNTEGMSGDGNHQGVAPDSFFLESDLNWLRQSEAILMLPGWRQITTTEPPRGKA